jgi:two-component system, LytTR family, response regulator
MSERVLLRAYVVDDEPLAARRLARLLAEAGSVDVVGATSDPEEALAFLRENSVDALFLDIEMPGLTGFELLARLHMHPPVVFTTAYDEYALRAFEVYAIDYLLKPVEAEHLARALAKLDRMREGRAGSADEGDAASFRGALERLAASFTERRREYPSRVASRVGDRVFFLDVAEVTHFHARDKLTYAVVRGKEYAVDHTIADLEERLDPSAFVRVHRSVLVSVRCVREAHSRLGGGLVLRLSDGKGTEITVARDRAKVVRERLGF